MKQSLIYVKISLLFIEHYHPCLFFAKRVIIHIIFHFANVWGIIFFYILDANERESLNLQKKYKETYLIKVLLGIKDLRAKVEK